MPSVRSRPGLTLFAAFLGWMFDGLEMGIFPLVARPALQTMDVTSLLASDAFVNLWMARITALFLLGAAAGGLIFGWLGDRFGRVRAMSASILVYSLCTGLAYFAHSPWELAACRFLAALGMGGEWSLGVALVMECWPDQRRPLMAGIIGAAANLGYALVAVIALRWKVTTDSWRWVMLVGASPAVLTFLIRLFVPESERWQEATRQPGKSRPVRDVFGPRLRRNTLLAICFASVALIVTWGIVQWTSIWADRMTNGTNPSAKAWTQLWQSLGATAGSLLAPFVGAWLGRRVTYFGMCLLALVLCQILFRGFHEFSAGFLVMVTLVGGATAAFYGWLPLYLPELFPTRVRATGQGVAFNSGRILAAAGAWQMSSVLDMFGQSHARAGAAISLIYLVGMALIWLAPETRGRPLPD